MEEQMKSRDSTSPGSSRSERPDAEQTPTKTPSTDMQPEDSGTAASGTESRGTASESVMKQEHKTGPESGGGRR
jgi:hypothetical protein